jgi:hypothetical protein
MDQNTKDNVREESVTEKQLIKSCNAIAAAVSSRNVVSLSEFSRFERMFDPNVQDRLRNNTLSDEEKMTLADLCMEFKDRFNLQAVIYVVDGGQVIKTVSPVIGQLSEMGNIVTDTLSEKIVNTIETMVRVNQDTSTQNHKLGDAISSLNTVMGHAITPAVIASNEAAANEYRTKVHQGVEAKPEPSVGVLSDMEWE